MTDSIIKVFVAVALSFFGGLFLTPFITDFLYKHKMWKKKSGKIGIDGKDTPIFNELHKEKEVGTPRLGGSVVWLSVILTTVILFAFGFDDLGFVSRNQTWIPFATLLLGAFIGLIDDVLEIKGNGSYKAGGLSLRKRLTAVALIGLFVGFWFYSRLDITSIALFDGHELFLGPWVIVLVMLVMLFMYSGGVIDGIDGLAGGVFAIAFASYSGIAFFQHQIDLAAFSAAVAGGILAFLWFNIPPARFYMSETGTMALTITLTVVAFMTDRLGEGHGLLALPIIALPLVLTTISDLIQIFSKKIRGKKVFLVAPLHHHFEALGWSGPKVTMRYWIISFIMGIIGMSLALLLR